MKGIVLAGGSGTRLHPITLGISKQLIPIYDKPMIYYPISVLMLAGIKDILIISTKDDIGSYEKLLGNGKSLGVRFTYEVQDSPEGLGQAFIIGENFIGDDKVALILGDNIFFGQGFSDILKKGKDNSGATIFSYQVSDPERFGVVELDKNSSPVSIEEKPCNPKSNLAVTGLYFYDNDVIRIAKEIKKSPRGEYEISSINESYLKKQKLNVQVLGRGFAWLDTGTNESLLSASHFVETIQSRQGYMIACLEEIAFSNGWITKEELLKLGMNLEKVDYGRYLVKLYNDSKD